MRNKQTIGRHRRACENDGGEVFAAIVMVVLAVLFNLYITTPIMADGVNDSGDDAYHVSQSYYLKKLLVEDHSVFGVVNAFGIGYPWFNNHQFLMYFAEVAVNLISFDSISILDAHKGLLVLFYSLFPVGVYYCMRKFKQTRVTSGLAALLAPLPISGWGHTISAYFVIGLTSQSLGGFLFPFALGSFHQLITEGRGPRRTALLYVLTSFAHPYYGYFLAFISAIDAAVTVWGKSRQDAIKVIKYASVAAVIAFLLALFWIVPLPQSIKYAPRTLSIQAVKEGFSLSTVGGYFLSGQILDATDNFGDPPDKNLRWPNNKDKGRLPILTALTLMGIAYGLLKRDRFQIFCILCLALAFAMILGPDDIPYLSYLPMSEFSNAKRAIYLFEFFAICLSASALMWVLNIVKSAASRLGKTTANTIAIVALVTIIATPYVERLQTANREVNTADHFFTSFDAIKQGIKEDGIDGRVYADDESEVKTASVIMSQPWLLDTPYMRRIYATRFWGNITLYPNVYGLFNIRYIVTGANKQMGDDIYTKLLSARQYNLYRIEGDYYPLLISHQKPALLSANESGWRVITEVWLHYYKSSTNPKNQPMIVEYLGQEVSPGDYSQLLKYESEPTASLLKSFKGRLKDGGGYSKRHQILRELIKTAKNVTAEDSITTILHTQNRYIAAVETDKPGLVAYKTTYHPNWKVIVDGVKQDTLRVSPEFPAVFIRPGKHIVEFTYQEPWFQKLLDAISLFTLCYVLLTIKNDQ